MLAPLPSYTFRPTPPTLWDMAVRSISDFASVVPATIEAWLLMDVTFAPNGLAAKVTLQVTTRSATGLNVTAQRWD